jgi:hypothetical protein
MHLGNTKKSCWTLVLARKLGTVPIRVGDSFCSSLTESAKANRRVRFVWEGLVEQSGKAKFFRLGSGGFAI